MVFTLVSPWIGPLSFLGKGYVSFGIFGILERTICWFGRKRKIKFSIAAFIVIFESTYWIAMIVSI